MRKRIYSVTEVNRYISGLVNSDYMLASICVKGEVSNCKYHSMGHIYFSLKDENGSIPCVMFHGNVASGLKFRLENGQEVTIFGRIGVYEKDAKVQLYARLIQLADDGRGKLAEAYEKLKEKLYAEGLFDFEVKKPIPKYPKRVGIVTASTGAAIQDIKNVAHRRNPYVQLILYPAKVQGEGAAETIVAGIRTLDKMGVDTIIIGRGGGSMEDLWAFNDERVARAIYAAKTPVISGTGHEVDNTIADYVADLRAPTPSAAAELAIPDVMTTVRRIRTLEESMNRGITGKLNRYRAALSGTRTRLGRMNPELMLRQRQQRLSELCDAMSYRIREKEGDSRRRLDLAVPALTRDMEKKYGDTEGRFQVAVTALNALSPTAKLVNGFGYISAAPGGENGTEGCPVRSVTELEKGETVFVTMHDGTAEAEVKDIQPVRPRKRRKTRDSVSVGQVAE